MLQTEILANIIYRFDDQHFLTSKPGLYLKDLRTAGDRHYRYAPWAPGGVQKGMQSKASSFFVQFKDA